jgi:hypothetical protein
MMTKTTLIAFVVRLVVVVVVDRGGAVDGCNWIVSNYSSSTCSCCCYDQLI